MKKWSPEEWRQVKAGFTHLKRRIDHAHAIALPAVIEDQERLFAALEEQNEIIQAQVPSPGHDNSDFALPKRDATSSSISIYMRITNGAGREELHSEMPRRKAAGERITFLPAYDLPEDWFDGDSVAIRFQERNHVWEAFCIGCDRLFLTFLHDDTTIWQGWVGRLPVSLPDVFPEEITAIVIASSGDNE